MTDDVELLRQYAETHSQDSFAELVRRHLNFVYGTALRRVGGNTHRAEEIAQTVFTDLARKAAKLSGHPSLTGWLHTSTRLAAAASVRSEQRRQIREQEAMAMNESISNSPPVPEWEKLRPVIDDALDQVNERDRTAVLQRFFENQPLVKIGQALSVSEDAARKRIDRALEKLRTQLARRGIASTTIALGLALANQVAVAAPAGLAPTITAAALANTVTAGSSSLLSFFAMTKLQSGTLAALIVATAATIGTTALAVVGSQQKAEFTALGSSADQTTTDNRRLAELNEKLAAAEKARDATRVELKKLADEKAKRAREEENALHGPAQMLWRRLYFRQNFASFFEQLKLDEATRSKFIEIQTEGDIADLAATLTTRKTIGDDDTPMEQQQSTWADTSKKIQTLLGEKGLAAYDEFLALQVSAPKDFALDLADAGCPLTPEQKQHLGHLWYQIIAFPQRTTEVSFIGDLSPLEETFLAQANKELSEPQSVTLRRYFVNENADLRALRSK